jgi:hypothetical protein
MVGTMSLDVHDDATVMRTYGKGFACDDAPKGLLHVCTNFGAVGPEGTQNVCKTAGGFSNPLRPNGLA